VSRTDLRLAVFDLDGTLVDSTADLATAVNAALAQVAPGSPRLEAEVVRSYVGHGARNLITRSLTALGLPHPPDDVLPVFLEAYRACLLDTTRLYPGIEEALEGLRGLTLAVLSNKPGDMSRTILAGLGVAGRFARIWGGGDVPGKKPDPAGLKLLLAELAVRPDQAVMIGDSGVDVQTGRAAGVRTLGVTYGFDAPTFAETPPDVLVDDPRRLAGILCPPRGATVLP